MRKVLVIMLATMLTLASCELTETPLEKNSLIENELNTIIDTSETPVETNSLIHANELNALINAYELIKEPGLLLFNERIEKASDLARDIYEYFAAATTAQELEDKFNSLLSYGGWMKESLTKVLDRQELYVFNYQFTYRSSMYGMSNWNIIVASMNDSIEIIEFMPHTDAFIMEHHVFENNEGIYLVVAGRQNPDTRNIFLSGWRIEPNSFSFQPLCVQDDSQKDMFIFEPEDESYSRLYTNDENLVLISFDNISNCVNKAITVNVKDNSMIWSDSFYGLDIPRTRNTH